MLKWISVQWNSLGKPLLAFSLRMAAMPVEPATSRLALESPTVEVQSAPVQLWAGQIVKIRGWAKVRPAPWDQSMVLGKAPLGDARLDRRRRFAPVCTPGYRIPPLSRLGFRNSKSALRAACDIESAVGDVLNQPRQLLQQMPVLQPILLGEQDRL